MKRFKYINDFKGGFMVKTIEAIGKIAVKHMKTSELIETLAKAELKEDYTFTPAEIVRAFTETNSFPFSRPDVDFIKSCFQSEALQQSKSRWETAAKEKNIDLAKSELKNYNKIRNSIKGKFKGLLYYKGGDPA